MFAWPQPQLMNEKTHFLHDVEKLALNHCIKHKCNGVYKITIVIVNHFYEELNIYVHQQFSDNLGHKILFIPSKQNFPFKNARY